MVEFSAYNALLKHYLAVLPTAGDDEEERAKAIVKNAKDAELTLKSLCIEMDNRYELLSKAGENKVTDYNEKYKARKLNPKKGHRFLPYLVTIVDEYADLTMTMGASPEVRAASKSIQNSIIRLAQKGRAAGIHVIIATQRPSVDVISGVIKGNFPLRIAFRVASRTDSMTILDSPGAEKLIGRGDMLLSAGIENERIQCGYVSGGEIKAITNFIGDQEGFGKSYNTPYYLPEVKEEEKEGGAKGELGEMDERFEEAAKLVVTTQRGSTSDLQRRLGMGYAKAGRVMDQLEQAGIVGPQEGSKPRTVLVSTLDDLETLLDNLKNA
jgi:S-DNA-T family DNA segregation ATPase FtsK/SpoIIIE